VALGTGKWRKGKWLHLYGRRSELHVIVSGSDDHAVNNKWTSPFIWTGSWI
jgi:hypothetical protein